MGGRYWKLWTSSAVANLGDGIFQVAVALLAVRLTRSPVLVSGVALAAAVAVDVASIALVYVVALGLGCAEVLFDTSSQTIMPAVVASRDDLSRANGRLYAAETITNQFVGPPLGGFLVAVSVASAVGAAAGLYAAAAVALVLLPGTYRTERSGPPSSLRVDIGEGLPYLFAHRLLRTLGLLLGAQTLLLSAQGAIFVLFAVSRRSGLGLSDVGVGVLFAFGALGGVAGSFVAAPVERALGRTRLLALSVAITAASLALPGLVPHVVVAGVAGAMVGVSAVMWNVVTVSLRQRIIPDQLLGRVNSGYRLLGWGTSPIGAALGGVLAEAFGLRAVFVLSGAGTLVLLVPLLRVISDASIAEAEAAAEAAASTSTSASAGAAG